MERIFHHYDKWEDYHAGMYDEDKTDRQTRVFRAARILGSPTLCRRAMEKVISDRKLHFLTIGGRFFENASQHERL